MHGFMEEEWGINRVGMLMGESLILRPIFYNEFLENHSMGNQWNLEGVCPL